VTSSEKVFAANTFLGKGLQFFEDVLHRAREMLSSQLTPTRIAALTGSMCFRALRVAVVVLVLVVIALPLVALGQETAESHTLELAASAQTGLPYALVVGAEARVFETVSVGVQYGAFFSWGPRTLHGDDGISAVRWHGDGWTSLNATLEGGLSVFEHHRVALRAALGHADRWVVDCGASNPPKCSSSEAAFYALSAVWVWQFAQHWELGGHFGAALLDPLVGSFTSPDGDPSTWLPIAGLSVSGVVRW